MEKERFIFAGDTNAPLSRRHTRESSNGDLETTGLSACDACYQKKIKCDRMSPCCNCQDSNSACVRLRQKQARKPRENVSSQLNETRQKMEARMVSLENTITGLRNAVSNTNHLARTLETSTSGYESPSNHPPGCNSQNRSSPSAAKEKAAACGMSSLSIWKTSTEAAIPTPLYSAVEAQSLIQKLLNHTSGRQKRHAFHSALSSLSESLNSSSLDNSPSSNAESLLRTQDLIDNPTIPDVEVIQWMLQRSDPIFLNETVANNRQANEAEHVLWSLPDGLPLISSNTAVQMSVDIQDPTKRKRNPAIVVVVTTLVAHFLLQKLMSSKIKTGLEAGIQKQITAYFATAQAALSQINILATPCLQNIQALIFGSVNAQEAGQPMDAWKLTTAAGNLCIILNLHKKVSSFSGAPPETLVQANYCFLLCYINDKGLAMNLGKPPSIPDAYLEVPMHELAPRFEPPFRQHLHDEMLELAIVQSAIIDLQYTKSGMSPDALDIEVARILAMMDKLWDLIIKINSNISANTERENLQFEVMLGKFSFYTIKTVLFHSCMRSFNQAKYLQPLLEAARASMGEMKTLKDSQVKFNDYKIHSFAHWSVLYYPFTSFFVLFCNVVSRQCMPDYERMLDFVGYLKDAKAHSVPVTKLYNLCLPFCALASTAIKNTEEPQSPRTDSRPSKRQKSSATNPHDQQPHQSDAQLPQHPPESEQDGVAQQNFDAQLGVGEQNIDMGMGLDDDNLLAQFMDFQPRLQWLDTDFSAFEETWE